MSRTQVLRNELTKSQIREFGAPLIGRMFKAFSKSINEIWEDYNTIEFYISEIHDRIKDDKIDTPTLEVLVSPYKSRALNKKTTFGILSRIKNTKNGSRAFVDAVGLFEQFIASLATKVYIDYPNKLKSLKNDNSLEDDKRRAKLMSFILESESIDEILSKVVEEKIRGIFYGNPVDLFKKDRAKIGFGDYFETNCADQLEIFAEITARRNVIVHSEGRIDRKYASEVNGGPFELGKKLSVDTEYLKNSIYVFKQLAAAAADQVATNMYGQPLIGKAARVKEAAKRAQMAQ